jgi:hypothetical protein
MGEAIAVELDAEPAARAEFHEHRFQIMGRVGAFAVLPDAHVGDVGRMARLAQVGRAGQQRDAAVAADVKALEEAEAEAVVAGEPIVALLREQQQTVEPALSHRREQPPLAGGHFVSGEMNGQMRTPAGARTAPPAKALQSAAVKSPQRQSWVRLKSLCRQAPNVTDRII